jgi:hypothetical protein
MKEIIEIILGLLLPCLTIFILFIPVTSCVDEMNKQNKIIHDCYIQEPRTKECQYIIWRTELNASKNKEDENFVTGMLLGQAMMGGK